MVPFHVDVVKFGGSHATHRHAFGSAPAPAQPSQAAQPAERPASPRPPVRVYLGNSLPDILGQGKPSAPALSQDLLSAIRTEAGHVADTLRYELEAVKAEGDMVSGQTLRTEPDLYRSISVIGPYLRPQEVRNAVINDARAIQTQAQRLLSGASAPYISAEQRAILSTIVSDAKAEMDYVANFDLLPLTGANAKLAQDHMDTHVKAAREIIDAIEREIVTGEAASVPVREPNESASGGAGTLLVVGALVAATVLLVELL
jgi:hypothetical protein